MHKVKISDQVWAFVRQQAPEPRRALQKGLDGLTESRGDIIALEENLMGFHRLRVGRFRVIIKYEDSTTIACLFAEERRLVYELFAATMKERL